MSDQYLRVRTRTGFSVAARYLEGLIECLKQGTIYLTHEGKSILLKPRTPVSIELEAASKASHGIWKEKMVLKLSWKIRESWSLGKGKEIFSIPRSEAADCASRNRPGSLPEPSGEPGRNGLEAGTSDTHRNETFSGTIEKRNVGHGTKRLKASVRKKPLVKNSASPKRRGQSGAA